MKIKFYQIFFILALFLSFGSSCEKENPNQEKAQIIYNIFEEWYLWYEHLPDIKPANYVDLDELVDDLKYKPIDQWSFVTSYQDYIALYENASTQGFGAGFIWDNDEKLKTSFTYSDSPFGRKGVDRGWIISKINNVPITTFDVAREQLSIEGALDLEFIDLEGNTYQHNISPADYSINTVLFDSIYTFEDKKIGYLVFNTFLGTAENDLNPVFDRFTAAGVNELIVDLRYNGGGRVNQALQLMANIAGSNVAGLKVGETMFNDKKEEENEDIFCPESNYDFGLNKVVFITTSQSASASELIINLLDPFMEVVTVGSNTHGKPVGMVVFTIEEQDLAIAPISFKDVNIDGYGDFFNGLESDINAFDDLAHAWGDTDENCLKKAIDYLMGNAALADKSVGVMQQKHLPVTGLNQIINAY